MDVNMDIGVSGFGPESAIDTAMVMVSGDGEKQQEARKKAGILESHETKDILQIITKLGIVKA